MIIGGRFSRWTIKEAAALVIEADPSVIIAYRYWPAEPQYAFDGLENILRRNFGTDLAPAALRKYGPRIGIENTLLWSAIDQFHGTHEPRQSSETVERYKVEDMFFGLSLRHGYSSEHPSVGIEKGARGARPSRSDCRWTEEIISQASQKNCHGESDQLKAELEYRCAKNGAG